MLNIQEYYEPITFPYFMGIECFSESNLEKGIDKVWNDVLINCRDKTIIKNI